MTLDLKAETVRRELQPNRTSRMYSKQYLAETVSIAEAIFPQAIENLVLALDKVRTEGGRVFFIGLGGSAANCSHAVNDFRKLCRIEAYTPTDNVAELTANINDSGWDSAFVNLLLNSRLTSKDALFVLSVGGGTTEVSAPISHAVMMCRNLKMKIFGIVGRDGGYTKKYGDYVIVIPSPAERLTPHTEAFQSVILHCLVSHPLLQRNPTKW